jgi:hypothetical protein
MQLLSLPNCQRAKRDGPRADLGLLPRSQPYWPEVDACQRNAATRDQLLIPVKACATFIPSGGDDGVRTRDLVVANHALSQLSYIPSGRTWIRTKDLSFIRAAL